MQHVDDLTNAAMQPAASRTRLLEMGHRFEQLTRGVLTPADSHALRARAVENALQALVIVEETLVGGAGPSPDGLPPKALR